jgi:hypothetical protein
MLLSAWPVWVGEHRYTLIASHLLTGRAAERLRLNPRKS